MKIICLEGIDGSGKSAVLEYLKENLHSRMHCSLYFNSFPSDSFTGLEAKKLLHSNEPGQEAIAQAFVRDFASVIENMNKHSSNETVLIVDRYLPSYIAYQGHVIGALKATEIICGQDARLPEWDFAIYLNCDLEKAYERISSRKASLNNVIDNQDKEFFSAIKQRYEYLFANSGKPVVEIDSNKSIDTVCLEAKEAIEMFLNALQ